MSDKYTKRRRQQSLIRNAFPDTKPSLITKPLVLDEKRKVMEEDKKPSN